MIELSCFNWVQLIKKEKMPSGAKLTALYLSTFMNAEHNIAWPSQARIAYETGQTKRTVIKWLNYLSDNQWLSIKKNHHHMSNGMQQYLHNEYLISIPKQTIEDALNEAIRGESIDPPDGSRGESVASRGEFIAEQGCAESTTNNKGITSNNNYMSGKPDESPANKKINTLKPTAKLILIFLNEKTGRNYQPVDSNIRLIIARLKEYDETRLRQVIAKKAREWLPDEKMNIYLRPATLFNAEKCAQYVGELGGS